MVKGIVERSMGGGRFFYPPVWVSPWQTRDVLPLYLCDFEVRSRHPQMGKITTPVIRHQHDVARIPREPRQHRLMGTDDWARSAFNWGNGEVDHWTPRAGVNLPFPASPRGRYTSPIRERSLSDGGWGSDDGTRGKENEVPMDTTPRPDTDATISID